MTTTSAPVTAAIIRDRDSSAWRRRISGFMCGLICWSLFSCFTSVLVIFSWLRKRRLLKAWVVRPRQRRTPAGKASCHIGRTTQVSCSRTDDKRDHRVPQEWTPMHRLDEALATEQRELDTVLLRLTTPRVLLASGKHRMVDRATCTALPSAGSSRPPWVAEPITSMTRSGSGSGAGRLVPSVLHPLWRCGAVVAPPFWHPVRVSLSQGPDRMPIPVMTVPTEEEA